MVTEESFWFWFGGIWLGIGLVFLSVAVIIGVNRVSLDAQLEAEGRQVDGIVRTKEIASARSSSPVYRVAFDFSTEGRESVRGSAELDPTVWDALVERGPIEVTYLPDRPQTYRVPGERPTDAISSFVFGSVGAVLTAIGGFVLLTALRNGRGPRSHAGIGADR